MPAGAQPAPNARPTGGQVVAGGAAISQSSPTTTVITQSTSRAAINWQSFSVGSQQSVDFQQPSSSAMTLNRVTGPDPSAIAGKITANGGVVLTNPNGVVFYKGSQVNAQDVIVSTAGITNQNFLAGNLVFDQAGKPDARIANAGTITVKDTGLAALVAPQVANSGVISARLGHAVLAGAAAATLDLYGDGLLSVDVTKQVTQAPKGGTALVTNTGTIMANGGEVLLTAQAADGVVQTLVSAGGHIAANSVGAKTGSIAIEGTGGSIVITGHLLAQGLAAGTTGGTIELNADKAVTVAGQARVNVSGAAGGGTVAIGTSLARAVGGPTVTGAPTAARTTIAKGAKILANATRSGNGGQVTVLSTQTTAMHGTIQAKGGATAGNGGTVEISTAGVLTLDGTVDVTAAHGTIGNILLDPYDLFIENGVSNTNLTDNTNPNLAYNTGGTTVGNNSTITPSQIEALHGNVHLQTTDNINVENSFALTTVGQGLTLEAGNSLTVAGGVTISTAGSIALIAASSSIPGFNAGGVLELLGSVGSTGGSILMQGGTGGVIIAGAVSAPAGGLIDLKGDTVSIDTGVLAEQLGGQGGFVSVPGGQLTIEPYTFGHPMALIGTAAATAGTLTVSTTELAFVNAATLALDTQLINGNSSTVSGSINIGVSAADPVALGTIGQLSLFASTITEGAPLTVGTLSGQTGIVTLTNASNQIGTIANLSANAFTIQDAIPLTFAGSDLIAGSATIGDTASVTITGQLGAIGTLTLNVAGAVTESTTGSIIDLGNPLTVIGSAGTLSLANFNSIDTLGPLTTTSGPITITDVQPLTITGPVNANAAALTIADTAAAITIAGNLAGSTINLGSTAAITQRSGTLDATTLFAQGTTLSLVGANTIATIGSLVATTGSITFSDQSAVTVLGQVTATGAISLATASNLLIDAAITTPGNVNLAASGSIIEGGGGGVIFAGTLSGNAGTGTSLTGTNEISAIATFASTGGFVLTQDTTALTIAGALSDNTSISLSTQGQILLAGTLSAPTVSLTTTESFSALNSGSNPVTAGQLATIESIIQSGGGVTADVLNINSAGGVNMLPGTNNSISSLGTISVANIFNLDNNTSITVGGPAIVSGPTINAGSGNDFYYQFYVNSPGDLVVSGPVSGKVVGLFATGNLTETTGGTITTGFLQAGGGTVALTQAANAIGEIDSLTSTTNLALTDGIPLLINGAISAGASNILTISNDALTLGASAALSAPGGTVQLAPVNPGDNISVGNASSLSSLTAITAGTLVIGSTTAGTVTVNTGTSNFDASSVGTLALVSGGAVTETGPDGIIANVLTGNVAINTSLTGANQITNLGSFTTPGVFTLVNSNPAGTPLTIAGPLTVGSVASVTSTTTPIVISGPVSGNIVDLATTGTASGTGGISESGAGAITTSANGLITTVSSSDRVNLTGANTVPDLVAIVGSGGLTLTDATSLLITSGTSLSATGPVVLNVTGSLTIGGAIGGTGSALNLTATGAITENANGALTGTSLTGSAASASLGELANTVGTLSTFTSTGGFTFLNGTALTVAGPITDGTQISIGAAGALGVTGNLSAPAVGLATSSGAAIGLAGNISAANEFALAAAGSVAQTSGTITSSLLTGSAGSTVALNGANTIGTVGSFTAGGSFSLNDSGALLVGGSLVAPAINLVTTGAIGEGTTAALITSLLTGSGTSASLPATGNQIAGVGSFSTGTGFALTDAVPVTISGTISTGTSHVISLVDNSIGFSAGGALLAPSGEVVLGPATSGATLTLGGTGGAATTAAEVLIDSSGPISITGGVNLAGVSTVLLVGGGAVTETGSGAITAPLLTGSAGSASLTGANTIASLGTFTTTGAFTLNDAGNLALTGTLTAPIATLISTGTISEATGAVLNVGTLAGAANAASLANANTIATLGSFSAATGLLLADTTSLAVAGNVSGGLLTGIETGGSIAISGTITTTLLSLGAAAAITESTGVISAGTLTGSGTSIALPGANTISTLGALSAAGGLVIGDTVPLSIAGAVTAGPSASFIGGNVVTEASGGSLTASTLLAAVGTLSLGGSNIIGTLASASAPGGLLLNDTESLVVTGPAGSAAVTSLTAAGSITILGSLYGGTVNLASTGTSSESGAGLINAGTLSGSFAAVALSGSNTVAALGSITTPATLTLTEPGSLAIAGPVTAAGVQFTLGGALTEASGGALITPSLSASATGGISLPGANLITAVTALSSSGAVSLNNATDLVLAGPVSGASVNLVSSGALTESGGVITTALLTGSANTASLAAANQVGTLGAFSTGGALSFTDVPALTVAGPVSAGAFTLTDTGAIALTGAVSTGTFSISSGGSIVQSAGTITAALLTGNAAGEAVFGPDAPGPVANIATLGAFTATGTLSVASGQAMTVAGPLSAASLALSAPGTLTLAGGTITTGPGTISASGPGAAIQQTGTTTVTGTTNPQLLLALTNGSGSISLNDLSAPTTALTLNTGSGSATGTINVASLAVIGAGGAVTLGGAVAGNSSQNAALISTISPTVNTNYTLNGCTIAAANCGAVVVTQPPPPPPPPPQTPSAADQVVESVVLPPNSGVSIVPDALAASADSSGGARSAFRIPFLSGLLAYVFSRDVDDPDLVLPNISDRDY